MTTFTFENLAQAIQGTGIYQETVRHIRGIAEKIKDFDLFKTETNRSLDEHRIRLEALERGKNQHRQSIVDSKLLMPDAFTGSPKELSCHDWSYRLKVFMGTRPPSLRDAMAAVEHRSG